MKNMIYDVKPRLVFNLDVGNGHFHIGNPKSKIDFFAHFSHTNSHIFTHIG